MTAVSPLRAVGFALACTLAACGSSGGGGDPPPSVPAGDFHAIGFKALHGAPDDVRTTVGTITSDGVAQLTDLGSTQNENGVITSDPGGPVVPFTLSSVGVLSLEDGLGGEAWRGGATRGGEIHAVASIPSSDPQESGFVVDLRKGAGLGVGTLGGAYHLCYFGAESGADSHFAAVGSATFDGLGSVDLATASYNADGGIVGPGLLSTGYGVASDGTFTLGTGFQGGALAGGDVAVAGGGVTSGAMNTTYVFIRRGSGLDDSRFTGTYTVVGVAFDLMTGKYYDYVGSVAAEGDGRCFFSITSYAEGALRASTMWNALYTVAADGTLDVTISGLGITMRGAIAPDGLFGMLGGGTSAGNDPTLAVLIRR